jgi:hypothetical protein
VSGERLVWPAVLARAAAVAALLVVMGLLLVRSSLGKRLFYDEYENLAYGEQLLDRGIGPPAHGQRMPILVLNALSCAPAGCRVRDLEVNEPARLLVRLPTIAFSLLLGLVVYAWASELFGPRSGFLALALYVFDPTALAHGKQVTSDMATAFFSVLAAWTFWRLVRGRGVAFSLLACAVATASAMVSKYTGVLLLPGFGLLLLAEAVVLWREGRFDAARLRERLGQSAAFVLLVLFLVNAAYRFEGSMTRADAYDWQSRALQFLKSVPVPLPLPRVFLMGLDRSQRIQEVFEPTRGYNYVLGRLSTHGTWYACPLMILLKAPLALFPLLALAAWRRRGAGSEPPPDGAFLIVPFAVVLAFFSLVAEAQLGIRYLLPGLPFLIIYASAAASGEASRRGRAAVALLVLWYAGSTLSYFPHPICHFNELIGRRLNAWLFLADSNLDWEDRSRDIARYQSAHPERPLVIDPRSPQAGWVLVPANDLVGIRDPELYRWLRENFAPVDHVGYSYLLFRVPPDRLREVLARERAAPVPGPAP